MSIRTKTICGCAGNLRACQRSRPSAIWLLSSEESGGSIALHVLTVEPGFVASDHHHSSEEEFFFVLDGEIEITVGNKTAVAGAGTFAYVPPFATHAFKPHGDRPCRILHWNSPGGHERLGATLQRLARSGHTSADEGRKLRENHEYFFHENSVPTKG
jgi:mannose-6-phosphate isomerase-like protein (cupin superfamily)